MAVTVVAQYRIRPGETGSVRAALRQMLEPTRREPGCLGYEVYVDPADPGLVVLVEAYVDADAFQAHLDSVHFERHLRGEVLPRLESRQRFELVRLEESSDLDTDRSELR